MPFSAKALAMAAFRSEDTRRRKEISGEINQQWRMNVSWLSPNARNRPRGAGGA